MGIQGLLPFLRKASRPANIKDFAGCTVAIDSYCWLHKGAFSCADKLGTGQETTQYVYYCLKYVNYLLSCGIKPIMVFDGCRLPSKQGVEKARQERREVNRKKAKQLLREGKNAEAKEYLQRSIDITPIMALELMKACRDKGVDCIVAPYEADAQLTYLNKAGIAQIIITEDSDLVLFGCDRIMFKMDFAGNGLLVERTKLSTAMDLRPDLYSFDKFRYMCILAGCDYLPSLPGIGLGKACKLFKITRQTDVNLMLRKLPTTLKMSNLTVSEEYRDGFFRANNTFLYQLVYDPIQRKLKPLNPYPPEIQPEEITYAGKPFPAERAYQIALGNIDLYTGEKLADFDPDKQQMKSNSWDKTKPYQLSIWDKNYKTMNNTPSTKTGPAISFQSTKNKEVTVETSFTRKTTPVPPKEDSLSDGDLLGMYNEIENMEPELKRPKLESKDNEISPPKDTKKTRLSFDELEIEPAIIATPERHTPVRSPLKSSYFENVRTDVETSPVNATPPEKEKEKKASKNVFAKNLNARKKFQINASKTNCKESRFFKSAAPLQKSAFGAALGEEELEEKPVTIKEENEKDEEKEDTRSPIISPVVGTPKPSTKLSLHQAFGFRKLDGASNELRLSGSPLTSKPFKPVMSRNNSNKSLDGLSQKSLSDSQQSNASAISNTDNSVFEDSLMKSTPHSSQSFLRSPTPSPSHTPKNNALKLKQKPGNLKRKCMDIASMFQRVPKKTFQYSANDNRIPKPSPAPDLPSLPDGVDLAD